MLRWGKSQPAHFCPPPHSTHILSRRWRMAGEHQRSRLLINEINQAIIRTLNNSVEELISEMYDQLDPQVTLHDCHPAAHTTHSQECDGRVGKLIYPHPHSCPIPGKRVPPVGGFSWSEKQRMRRTRVACLLISAVPRPGQRAL